MRVDGVLLAALAAIAGGVCAVYPGPALFCALFAVLVLGRAVSSRARLFAVLFCALGAARGALQVHSFETARITARDAIGPPSRCDLSGVVAVSPVWSDGTASFVADVSQAECEGRSLPT